MYGAYNVLNWFKSEEKIQDLKRQKDIMAKKPNNFFEKSPRGDHWFPQENWVDLIVEQKGQKIQLQTYRYPHSDKTELKGVVIMFHGLNGHLNTGAHIAHHLAQQGLDVVGFEYRGHGKSQGIPGLIETGEKHIQDGQDFIELVEKEYPLLDIFLLGQSFGGQTCFRLGLLNPQKFTGVIMFAPAIYDLKEHCKLDKYACKFLGSLLPEKKIIEQGKAGGTNKNPQISEDSFTDSLMYNGKIYPSVIKELLRLSDDSQSKMKDFHCPFLVIQGGVDKWIDPKVASELVKQSPSQDKSMLYYENVWHNIWAEQEIFDMLPKISNWIGGRLPVKDNNNNENNSQTDIIDTKC